MSLPVGGDSGVELARLVADRVRDVPDFPQPGIGFKDLSPLFADGKAFHEAIEAIVAYHGRDAFDAVAGIEARGFVIASAVAYATGVGLVPVRKAGKLPAPVISEAYDLEYGQAVLEVHRDAFAGGQRVLVIDDVLATGGTAAATVSLVERSGGAVVGISVLLELGFLAGRQRLPGQRVQSLLIVP